jgi:hypothetical protein
VSWEVDVASVEANVEVERRHTNFLRIVFEPHDVAAPV